MKKPARITDGFFYFLKTDMLRIMTKNIILGIDCDDTLWQLDCHYKIVKNNIAKYIAPHLGSIDDSLTLFDRHMCDRIGHQGVGYIMMEHAAIYAMIEAKGSASKDDIEFFKTETHQIANLNLTPYDGVTETLEHLSKNYRLLAFTKGHPSEQRTKFQNSGLSHFFDNIEVMHYKNSNDYQYVIKKYAINLQQFYMVGNSLKSDILPVLEIGGQAIHIPCPHYDWAYDIPHDDEVRGKNFTTLERFSDLPDFLKNVR